MVPSHHTAIGANSLEHQERYSFLRSGTFWLRYWIPSDSGKCIGFGLKLETGAERTTIVDIFDIIQQVR